MAKKKVTETDIVRAVDRLRSRLDQAFTEILPIRTFTRTRYMTYVRGIVPYGERPRDSVDSCRRFLRRQLVHAFQSHTRWALTLQGEAVNPRMPNEEWSLCRNAGLSRIMAELEASGEIEYRPIPYGSVEPTLT